MTPEEHARQVHDVRLSLLLGLTPEERHGVYARRKRQAWKRPAFKPIARVEGEHSYTPPTVSERLL